MAIGSLVSYRRCSGQSTDKMPRFGQLRPNQSPALATTLDYLPVGPFSDSALHRGDQLTQRLAVRQSFASVDSLLQESRWVSDNSLHAGQKLALALQAVSM